MHVLRGFLLSVAVDYVLLPICVMNQ